MEYFEWSTYPSWLHDRRRNRKNVSWILDGKCGRKLESIGGDVFHRQNFCRWKKVNFSFFHRQFLKKLKIWLSIFFHRQMSTFSHRQQSSSQTFEIVNINCVDSHWTSDSKKNWWEAIFLYENYDYLHWFRHVTTPSNSLKSTLSRLECLVEPPWTVHFDLRPSTLDSTRQWTSMNHTILIFRSRGESWRSKRGKLDGPESGRSIWKWTVPG